MLLWFYTLFIYTVVYLSSAHLVKETKERRNEGTKERRNEGTKEQQRLSGKKMQVNLLKTKHRARAAMNAEKQAGADHQASAEKQTGADRQANAAHQVSADHQADGLQVLDSLAEQANKKQGATTITTTNTLSSTTHEFMSNIASLATGNTR